jgi:hypothetical protein
MNQRPVINSVVEGDTINLVEFFLDDFDEPIFPNETTTGPEVLLFDNDMDRSIINNGVATVGQDPGSWQVDFSIPKLGLQDVSYYTVRWTMVDEDNQTHVLKTVIEVHPCVDNRESDIVFLKPVRGIGYLDITVPESFNASKGDTLTLSAYLNNDPVFEELDVSDPQNGIKVTATTTKTNIRIRDAFTASALAPHTILIQYQKSGMMMPKILSHNLWVITPSIATAMNLVEAHIHKAKLDNVIPSLQYTPGDLVTYLYRGLNLLNTIPPLATGFTGTNMQGHMLDAWLTCASYYALGAQLQAEGALAFDFSGQTVNLNIDRTPSIEAALGRIEQHIDAHLRPYKKMLVKAGIVSGDGSQGGSTISYGKSFGIVTVLNSPTTRFQHGGGGGRGLNGWTSSGRGRGVR